MPELTPNPDASDAAWNESAIHCTGPEVDALFHYGHIIPISRGFTRKFLDEHFPGWDWNGLVAVLKAADVFVDRGGSPPQCRPGVTAIHFTDADNWAVEWFDGSLTSSAAPSS
jgi:hypothetical protein